MVEQDNDADCLAKGRRVPRQPKVLSKDALEYALQKESESGVPLAKILSAEGLVSERDLVAAVADQLSIPFWDPTMTPVSPLVDGVIPADVARKHMVVGLALDGDTMLVATDNPLDEATLNVVTQVTGWKARPCLATRDRHRRGHLGHVRTEPGHCGGQLRLVPRPGAELHVNQILVKSGRDQGFRPPPHRGAAAHGAGARGPCSLLKALRY